VHRRADQSLGRADYLAQIDNVACLHDRDARLAAVLMQGNRNPHGRFGVADRKPFGRLFADAELHGMNSA